MFDEIINTINDFLLPFDLTCDIGEEFAYYPIHNLISVTLLVNDRCSTNFLSFVNKEFKDIKADIFLWSLLHEIGHHETLDLFEDDEYNLFQELKQNLVHDESSYNDEKDFEYFYLEDEYTATAWAANYMRVHNIEIKNFWNKLQKVILNFYKKNNIERN